MTGGIEVFINKCNVIGGAIVTLLSYVFGTHWVLFAAFLCLNLVDYATGCIKSHMTGKTNSAKGLNGALKKLGYWIMIMLAFGMNVIFEEIGEAININLGVTSLIGWFVLATLIINEVRSIIENFVEAGFPIPASIVKGLEVANKAIDGTINPQNGGVDLHISQDELKEKKTVTLKIDDQ